MKKTNNKGFSLVELIIVIAIMAILAGAIAPALIRYIDKSRRSNDISSAKTIKTAVETALGNESIYEIITNLGTGATADDVAVLEFVAGAKSSAVNAGGECVIISGCTDPDTTDAVDLVSCESEIATNVGESMPKTKYKKDVDADNGSTITPETFYALVSQKGTVYVGVGPTGASPSLDSTKSGALAVSGIIELTPETDTNYQ